LTFTDEPPQTTAESTGYRETSKFANVVSFCEQLAKLSPIVKLGELGRSHEGRILPLLILADTPISTAEAARASDKLVVMVVANIHAGEVDGKEAILTLAREIALGKERPLLKNAILVIAPILNADGNERFGNHRPAQAGPPLVGTRANAQNLDLNRDFVKLESREVRAVVRTLNAWDPAVYIDLHTTNGSFHRYALTFEGGGCPAGDARIIDYTRKKVLPTVSERMEAATGLKSTFYGNFNRDRSRWETVPPTPRYGTHLVGLTNRISILSESYSYSPFPERVRASKAFVKEIMTFVGERRDEIKKMLADVRADSRRQPKPNETIVLRQKGISTDGPKTILGFEEETKDGKRRKTEKLKEYPVQYMGGSEPTLQVKLPFAYVIRWPTPEVAQKLLQHGIECEELIQEFGAEMESFKIEKVVRGRAFQGHQPTTVEALSMSMSRHSLPKGTVIVRTAQPLGRLAAYLLEPQSADGFVQWNFFDKELESESGFQVSRLPKEIPLPTHKLPSLDHSTDPDLRP
jgi:dipeptidyl-peptidase 4